ncbi:tol-pal system YbgF family protein [Candidatus Latescibacterota bacterium]
MFPFSARASEAARMIDQAAHFVETAKPDSAAVILYELVDFLEDPEERVKAFYYLAMTMRQLGRLHEEMQYLTSAMEISPDAEYADNVRYSYTRILLETNNHDDCIAIARDFRERYTTSPLMPEMLYLAGEAYLQQGEYLRSFNSFNEITKQYPESIAAAESVMKEGVCLYFLNYNSGAIERFERYLMEIPHGENTDEALYLLGLSYERSQQPEYAVEVFKRLTMEYPSFKNVMETYFRLSKDYFEINRFVESENSLINLS